MQHEWNRHDYRNLKAPTCKYERTSGPFDWCRHEGLDKKNGKFKLMIIGNSWAANHARIFYDECGKKANSIVQFTIAGCDPFVSYRFSAKTCIPALKTFVEAVKKEKPDYLFSFSRMVDINDPIPSNSTDDPIFKLMRVQKNQLVKHVKRKMLLLNALPDISYTDVSKIIKTVKNGKDLNQFDKSLIAVDATIARERYSKLIAECPKCELIDYKPLFYNNSTKTWRFYDVENGGLSYFTSQSHFSFHGLELIRKVYTDICNKL
ncbi:hypothetical protein CRE_06268 [Caenorhabditis remanei]|uniref:SGNH domain-containing protein n=1 Tax=Caenorhabditis remanei TaxID=31234 RepID=E3NVM0_CAERE|nr:hypothetical protein CRE_06268 [Caenorhabditis remanei]